MNYNLICLVIEFSQPINGQIINFPNCSITTIENNISNLLIIVVTGAILIMTPSDAPL